MTNPPSTLKKLTQAATVVLAIGALAACETTTTSPASGPETSGSARTAETATAAAPSPVVQSGSGRVQRAADAAPGERPVPAARAVQYYSALCGQAANGRRAVEAAAGANGFVQNTKTGTYYHPQDNLSVKLTENICSMVFASESASSSVLAAFNGLSGTLSTTRARDQGKRQGKNYYSAALPL